MRLFLLTLSLILIALPSRAVVGEDDRFYIHDTKWGDLFSGVIQWEFTIKDSFFSKTVYLPAQCTGFVLEGDIVVSNAHCFHLTTIPTKGLGWIGSARLGDVLFTGEGLWDKLKAYYYLISGGWGGYRNLHDHSRRSKAYAAKNVYIGTNFKDCSGIPGSEMAEKDFAFFTLAKPIPKEVKRFKLLKDMNLEEYEILGKEAERGLRVSTVGYGIDSMSGEQRMAHLGCRIRETYKGEESVSFLTDCDVFSGQSGSPLFKILRHKRTGKIEFGVIGIMQASSAYSSVERDFPLFRKGHELGYGPKYDTTSLGSYSAAIHFNEDMYEKLNEFRKDPSSFAGQEVPRFEDRDIPTVFNRKIADIIRRSSSKEDFEKLLEKNVYDFFEYKITCTNEEHSITDILKEIQDNEVVFGDEFSVNLNDNPEKAQIFDEFISDVSDFEEIVEEGEEIKRDYLLRRALSPEAKKIVYGQNVRDDFFVSPPLDSKERNKKKAKRMWDLYFGDDSSGSE